MQTVKLRAGDTIIAEGDDGNTAFLIVSGSVQVSVGKEPKAKLVATLTAGDVFGEMSLIEPSPRSATVKAVTDTECLATTYDEFIPLMQNDPQRAITFMGSLVRKLREMNNLLSIAPAEVLGQRIQQSLRLILAGLEGHDTLSGSDLDELGHELRMLLQTDRVQLATAEIDKAEPLVRQIRADGPGYLESVRNGRGPGIHGSVRSLGPECRIPAPVSGTGDHARPVHPQPVPRHAPDVCV